jgi:hypothetical protein
VDLQSHVPVVVLVRRQQAQHHVIGVAMGHDRVARVSSEVRPPPACVGTPKLPPHPPRWGRGDHEGTAGTPLTR